MTFIDCKKGNCWGRCFLKKKKKNLLKKSQEEIENKEISRKEGKKEHSDVMFRIKATLQMCNLWCAYLQPFLPPALALRSWLWWICTRGLQPATLQAAAQHPAHWHSSCWALLRRIIRAAPMRKWIDTEANSSSQNWLDETLEAELKY